MQKKWQENNVIIQVINGKLDLIDFINWLNSVMVVSLDAFVTKVSINNIGYNCKIVSF